MNLIALMPPLSLIKRLKMYLQLQATFQVQVQDFYLSHTRLYREYITSSEM